MNKTVITFYTCASNCRESHITCLPSWSYILLIAVADNMDLPVWSARWEHHMLSLTDNIRLSVPTQETVTSGLQVRRSRKFRSAVGPRFR